MGQWLCSLWNLHFFFNEIMKCGFWICAFLRVKRFEGQSPHTFEPGSASAQACPNQQCKANRRVRVWVRECVWPWRQPVAQADSSTAVHAAAPVECAHDALSRILGEISSHHTFASTPTVPPHCSMYIDCLHCQRTDFCQVGARDGVLKYVGHVTCCSVCLVHYF